MDFVGQTILITGASRGIGAAIATEFAAEGGQVVVNYLRNVEAANSVVAACKRAGGDAIAVQADVTNPDDVNKLVVSAVDEFGRIDVLVNNAFKPYEFDPENRRRFWELGWVDYQSQIEGTLFSAYTTCQAVLPEFQRRASGTIINIASDLIARPTIPYHEYTTAKSALVGFTRNLAAEVGPIGVRANCVAPGLVYPTEASRHTKENLKEDLIGQTPLRRIARPDDIAGPVMFLASKWSSFVTGQTLYVDGGLVMR